jgi:hypothetical protein
VSIYTIVIFRTLSLRTQNCSSINSDILSELNSIFTYENLESMTKINNNYNKHNTDKKKEWIHEVPGYWIEHALNEHNHKIDKK